jgi:Flp pilus assembly pilin Flp
MRTVQSASHQRGASVVEYSLLVAVVSLSLVLALPAFGTGLCELNNRVGSFLGTASVACPPNGRGNNGGGNNNGSGNNGGGNNPGGGNSNGNGNGNGGGNGNGNGNGNGRG